MRIRAKHFLIVGLLLGALALFYRQSHPISLAEHERFDHQANQIQRLDTTLNADVLKVRFHLLEDYDGLPAKIAELHATVAALEKVPAFVPEASRRLIGEQRQGLAQLVAQKEALLESFKSKNAVLNNSMRHLPVVGSELIRRISAEAEGRVVTPLLSELMRQVLTYSIRPSEEQTPEIRRSLEALAQWRAAHPDHALNPPLARLAAHVHSILTHKPAVDALTREFVAVRVGERAAEILRIYDAAFARSLHKSDVHKVVLYILCALLVLGVGWAFYGLDGARRNLQRRVDERTHDLRQEVLERRAAEADLLKSKVFLQSTLDALSAHLAMLDATGTIVAVNATWSRFAAANGGSGDAFGIGASYLKVCERATGDCSAEAVAVAAGIRRVMDDEAMDFHHEYPCHSPQEERWFVIRVTRFESNGALFMVVAHEDVTARTQAERKLRMQQAELRTLFDFLPAMICFKDTDNRILRANRRVAESVGKPISEIEGKSTAEIYPRESDKFFADDLEVIHSGRPKLGIIESFCNAEGREYWIETDKAPVFDSDGKVIGLIAMAQDVTAHRHADEELRLLSSAVAQAKESIVITDADLDAPGPRIVFVNPAFTEMTGYLAEEVLGESPRKLQGPQTDKGVLRRLRQNLERGEAFTGEAINYRKDGTEFVVAWQIAPIRKAAGTITHFVAIQRDITEHKRAENALADIQRQLVVASRQAGMAEVATGVLHNVGNVLNSVNVSSTLVADTVRKSKISNLQRVVALLEAHAADLGAFVSSDPQGKNLAAYLRQLHARLVQEQTSVLTEIEALRGNIDHIKDIVAMQQSYSTFAGVTEVVELSALVEDALRMNSSSLVRHDVQIVREFEQIPGVAVDKHKLLQILVNLVRNAKQACDDSGHAEKLLTFRVTNGNAHVRVAVSDNGVGISAENLTRIFAHGFTTKKNGHGFGLHSSALAAKEMGGSLRVHSDGLGCGATFTVELPLSPTPALL